MQTRELAPKSRIESIVSGNFGKLPPPPEQWSHFMSPEPPKVNTYHEVVGLSSQDYAAHINSVARTVVESPNYHDSDGYISRDAWKYLVDNGMLAASIGDRNPEHRQEDIMAVSRILSWNDTPLGLAFGITTALAILPIQRFGSPEQKAKYLGKIREGKMFGLAVTELNKSGSNALDMDSSYSLNEDGSVHLKFEKHIQGLSGRDGLVVTALKENEPVKTMGIFIVDQEDIDTKKTRTIGLKGVPFGINKGDVTLNTEDHLLAELPRKRLDEFNDLFTKSRMMFVSMTLGQQERAEVEAMNFAEERVIANEPGKGDITQAEHPVTKNVLGRMRTRRIISEAVFKRSANVRMEGESLYNADTRKQVQAEVDIIKTLPTDYAIQIAADRAELMGAAAFYEGSALQQFIDSWPFQIFEGSRLMLNTSIGRDFSRSVKSPGADGYFGQALDTGNMDADLPQMITEMRLNSSNKILQEILGRIAMRCFALESLDPESIDPGDFEKARSLLNLEIKQIAVEFASEKSLPNEESGFESSK